MIVFIGILCTPIVLLLLRFWDIHRRAVALQRSVQRTHHVFRHVALDIKHHLPADAVKGMGNYTWADVIVDNDAVILFGYTPRFGKKIYGRPITINRDTRVMNYASNLYNSVLHRVKINSPYIDLEVKNRSHEANVNIRLKSNDLAHSLNSLNVAL